MKTEQPILITSIKASANINKNYLVGFDGNLCSANAKPLGVSNANADSGEQLPVVCKGIALVYSYTTISQGAALVCQTGGKVTPAANFNVVVPNGSTAVNSNSAQPTLTLSGTVLPQSLVGYALDAATGADELIRILLS